MCNNRNNNFFYLPVICNFNDLKTDANIKKRVQSPFAALARCLGSDKNSSPESLHRQRWRKFSSRNRITPMEPTVPRLEDGIGPRNPNTDCTQQIPQNITTDVFEPSEEPITRCEGEDQEECEETQARAIVQDLEDDDFTGSLKSMSIGGIGDDDGEEDSEEENFEFVSPRFLSSSPLSWNFDEPPC